MNLVTGLLRAMRPHQWTKNFFVFAPLLFAGDVRQEGRVLRVLAAFAIFSLMASAVYLLNDSFDRQADRAHPRKRFRPIASGLVPVPLALTMSALLAAAAVAWSRYGLESRPLTVVCLTYLSIQVLYTWRLKHLVILDVLCISSGFVLRLLAGGYASWSPLSQWIVVCTVFLSLFLALCKRRHEVVTLGEDARQHRATLDHYPVELLDQLISVAVGAVLVTYALYTVDERTLRVHHLIDEQSIASGTGQLSPLLLTLPFVIYGIARYLYLVYRQELGGSPTTTLMKDPPSMVNGLLYGLSVLAVFRWLG